MRERLRDKLRIDAFCKTRPVERILDVRAMLERASGYEPSVVEGRFMIHVVHRQRPWIVIVEPDGDAKLLVVVTPYEVSQ